MVAVVDQRGPGTGAGYGNDCRRWKGALARVSLLGGLWLIGFCGPAGGLVLAQTSRPVAADRVLTIRAIRYEQPGEGLGRVIIEYDGSSDRVDIRRVGDELVMDFEGAAIADRLLGSHAFDSPLSPVDTLQVTRLADRIQMVVVQRVGVRKVSNFQSETRYVLGFEQGFEKIFPVAGKAARPLQNEDSRTRVRNVIVDRSPSGSADWVIVEFSDSPELAVRRVGDRLTVTARGAVLPERLAQGVVVPEWTNAIAGVKASTAGDAVELAIDLRPGGWEIDNFVRGNQLVLVMSESAQAKPAAVEAAIAAAATNEESDDVEAPRAAALKDAVCIAPPRQRRVTGGAKRVVGAQNAFRDCPDCPSMIVAPAGEFAMGPVAGEAGQRRNELPQHRVKLPAFAISQYEVTWGEFRLFVNATKRQRPASCRGWDSARSLWTNLPGLNWEQPGYTQTDKQPAVCVAWEDARAYTVWLSGVTGLPYRLPTEAEWEYAARAGDLAASPWANDPQEACEHGNVPDETDQGGAMWANRYACRDGYWATAPVGGFRPNDFGVFDSLGNVWEWVDDCWNANYEKTPVDDRAMVCGDCSRRVLRGGAWNTRPEAVRFAYRKSANAGRRAANIGFRIARDLD